jgi:predicted nucleic acid-binding protein
MKVAIDTSILVAAMVATEAYHPQCAALLDCGGIGFYAHGLSEAFGTLTGGRMAFRMGANRVAEMMGEDYLPCLSVITLTPAEMLRSMRECEARGVRGAAIFDFHHLVAARKAGAARIYTLNLAHFQSFHRVGDPEIVHP